MLLYSSVPSDLKCPNIFNKCMSRGRELVSLLHYQNCKGFCYFQVMHRLVIARIEGLH